MSGKIRAGERLFSWQRWRESARNYMKQRRWMGQTVSRRWSILPCLRWTIQSLFESVFVLQNDAVIKVSDVLQTYIYTQTFNSGAIPDYGYTTAVGMFSSIISCILVLVCNRVSHKTRGRGIVWWKRKWKFLISYWS